MCHLAHEPNVDARKPWLGVFCTYFVSLPSIYFYFPYVRSPVLQRTI